MSPSPSLSLGSFLPFRLSVATNLVSDVIATAYQQLFGLKIAEWRLVAVIAETDGITQQAIGQRTRMDKVTVSRAALALIERGLVVRVPNPDDGRSQLLSLTAEGLELYRQVVPKALALEARLFDGFSEDETASLRAMLARIEAAALEIRNEA